MNDNELMDKLKHDATFNPWLNVSKQWLSEINNGINRDNFILSSDQENVENHNKCAVNWCCKNNKKKGSDSQLMYEDFLLHKEIMPQPFIGNPEAPIWILLENPGYSTADIYDLISVEMGRKELMKDNIGPEYIIENDINKEKSFLKDRKELVCKQLMFDFENDSAFYVLRPEFRTIRQVGRTVQGAYNWYKKYFGCKTGYFSGNSCLLKVLSNNIFLMEYIPYHSKRFHNFDIRFTHNNMWENMIRHAITEKIIVARNPLILKHIKNTVAPKEFTKAEKERRIIQFEGMSTSFSVSNTCWPCSDIAEVNPIIKQINISNL